MKTPTLKNNASAGSWLSSVEARSLLGAILVLFGCSLSARAANMTLSAALLDSLNGTVDFSQSTIGSGALAVSNTLAPGDTVFIEAHTRKFLILRNLTQGTTANPVTITNTGGQFVIEIPTVDDAAGHGMVLGGCQHVILKGTPGTGYTYGIKLNGSRYELGNSAPGLRITDNGQSVASGNWVGALDVEVTGIEVANSGFAGIMAKSDAAPTGYVLDGLHIHHNYIHDTETEGMYLGLTTVNPAHTLANVEVNDNLLENLGWDGIQLNTCLTNGKVHHNTIIGYGIQSHEVSFKSPGESPHWQNDGITGGKNEVDIYNNWIEATADGGGAGIFLSVRKSHNIYNNVVIHRGDSGPTNIEPGVYMRDDNLVAGTTVKIINNTIVTPEGPGVRDQTTAPVYYYNNIVAQPGAGYGYVESGAPFTSSNAVHESTVAGVGFVNPAAGDYNLTASSPAYNAGMDVSSHGVTTDFVGTARPQAGTYDVGAYELQPTTIITPVAWGQGGGAYCPATGAFDEQPTWNATAGAPAGVSSAPHASTATGYANRYWYVDFGANYANLRITEMWTRYRPSSSGNQAGFGTMWWDADLDTVKEGPDATGFKFNSAQGLSSSGSQQWVRDADFNGTPKTPAARYLIVPTGSTVTDRANEFAFVGYTVP